MLYKKKKLFIKTPKNKHIPTHTHTHTRTHKHTNTNWGSALFCILLAWYPYEIHGFFFLFLHIKDRTSSKTTKWLLHIALFGIVDWVGLAMGFRFTHLYVYQYVSTVGIQVNINFKRHLKFLVQIFLPLPNGKKLLLITQAHLLGLEWILPGAWSQKETTTLKHGLGFQMFLILNFPVTTRVLNFFKGHMNEYTGLIMSE